MPDPSDRALHDADVGNLLEKVRCFISDLPTPSPDGGWAPVTRADRDTLCEIFDDIINLRWGPDADMDRPIEFKIVDRNTHHFIWPYALPYILPDSEADRRFEDLLSLLSFTVGDIQSLMRIQALRRAQTEGTADPPAAAPEVQPSADEDPEALQLRLWDDHTPDQSSSSSPPSDPA